MANRDPDALTAGERAEVQRLDAIVAAIEREHPLKRPRWTRTMENAHDPWEPPRVNTAAYNTLRAIVRRLTGE